MFDNPTYLDFNLVKGLPIVHTNHTSDHLWDNDHVAEMSPHWLWLLTLRSLTLLQFWKIESTIKTPIYSNRVYLICTDKRWFQDYWYTVALTALRSFLIKAMGLRFKPL
jgi:hypothetical protein